MTTLAAFTPEFLEAAAVLLAQRHAADRRKAPLLPVRFGQPANAQGALEALRRRRTGGLIAFDGEQLQGYLIGAADESALTGRTVWFAPESYALAPDAEPELLRILYAGQAGRWVEQGYFNHYVMAPARSPLLDAWLSLGFAYQQAFALLDLAEVENVAPPAGLTLRMARPEDGPALAAMAHFTAAHQTRSPVFAPAPSEYFDELREGYAGLVQNDETAAVWLALMDGDLIGVQAYYEAPAAENNFLSDDGWIELAAANIHPDQRGRGIGRALTAAGLGWARRQGYAVCLADWRVTNLLAARFWPRRGFTPVYYRLERRIDPRIAWAHR
jgi:ribosomal protein S18 acetylase RimI-like enzyme